jgi:hypothetical protein
MDNAQLQALTEYVYANSAHECGHMIVLFRANRLVGLNFLPHEVAADGAKGVLESEPLTQLGKEDCVGLAAGMIGELVGIGSYDPQRLLDDAEKVQQFVGQPLENFALEAYEVIKQNLFFFVLLTIEVRTKMFGVLKDALFLPLKDYLELPDKMPIITLAEVQIVYGRAESELAGFPDMTGSR